MALPNTPPISLSQIMVEFEATSLADAGAKAGLSPPHSLLDFLGLSAREDHNVSVAFRNGPFGPRYGYESSVLGVLSPTSSVFMHVDDNNPTVPNTITSLYVEQFNSVYYRVVIELAATSSHALGNFIRLNTTSPSSHSVYLQRITGGTFIAESTEHGPVKPLYDLFVAANGGIATLHFEDAAPAPRVAKTYSITASQRFDAVGSYYGWDGSMGSLNSTNVHSLTGFSANTVLGLSSVQLYSHEFKADLLQRPVRMTVSGTTYNFSITPSGAVSTSTTLWNLLKTAGLNGSNVSFTVLADSPTYRQL